MKSYSQNNEQEVILSFVGDNPVTFLDIGANSKTLSNTYALALMGHKGICIEPSPSAFQQLERDHYKHRQVICYNVAISNFIGESEFFESGSHLDETDTGLLSTLKVKERDKWSGVADFRKIIVDVIDFDTLMLRAPYSQYDIISMDCEGSELDILVQMDLAELGCKCIIVEHNSKREVLEAIVEYCKQFGLTKELLRNGENIILSLP